MLGIWHTCKCSKSSRTLCCESIQPIHLVLAFHLGCMLDAMCNVQQRMNILVSFRFVGLHRANDRKYGKWSSRYVVMGQVHNLGQYATEELAAQAYDRVLIYQASTQPHCVWRCALCSKLKGLLNQWYVRGVGARNFPQARYDVESIY